MLKFKAGDIIKYDTSIERMFDSETIDYCELRVEYGICLEDIKKDRKAMNVYRFDTNQKWTLHINSYLIEKI